METERKGGNGKIDQTKTSETDLSKKTTRSGNRAGRRKKGNEKSENQGQGERGGAL